MTLIITIFCCNTDSTMDLKTSVITRFQCANVLVSMRMEDGIYSPCWFLVNDSICIPKIIIDHFDFVSKKGDQSTKIEGVIRVLLQIKRTDPSAKVLIFSTVSSTCVSKNIRNYRFRFWEIISWWLHWGRHSSFCLDFHEFSCIQIHHCIQLFVVSVARCSGLAWESPVGERHQFPISQCSS